MYYNRSGQPISREAWGVMFAGGYGDLERRVAFDEVGEAEISTVFVGLNHSFDDGPPLIFETMIFGGERDGDQWRYSTEEEALAGHQRMVKELS